MSGLPETFMREAIALLHMDADSIHSELSAFTESPIETLFATAFVMSGRMGNGEVAFRERGYDRDSFPSGFEWILSFQHQIGAYRVDFLATSNPARSQQQVIIECDGHAFHERTKEQAARDRSRDRSLQAQGYKVFRFTGSELYRRPFGCAQEVFDELLRQSSLDVGL